MILFGLKNWFDTLHLGYFHGKITKGQITFCCLIYTNIRVNSIQFDRIWFNFTVIIAKSRNSKILVEVLIVAIVKALIVVIVKALIVVIVKVLIVKIVIITVQVIFKIVIESNRLGVNLLIKKHL